MRTCIVLLLLVCAAQAQQPVRAVAHRPVVNMYSKPTVDADVVSQAIYATNVEVLETQSGWCRIRTPDQYTGWVQAILLHPVDRPYAASGRVAEVSSLFAHLYREKSVTRHEPLLTVPFETRLELGPDSDGRWLSVSLPSGSRAWVQRGDVVVDPPARLTIDAVVALSKRFLGLPYTWGGTSSYGYDCSGFTQMLLRRRGIHMPRDAHMQAAWDGVAPVTDGLRPGDLLFFGSSEQKITHTGMYIGNGAFIHATTHERPVIQISRLDDPHWARLLVCSRRPK